MTDTDPNDVRDDPLSSTTRRGALAALGLGGLAALGSGSASADIGGGPASDAMSDHRVPFYRVPESELDSPGVVGRRVEITSGGAQYETGDQLVDTDAGRSGVRIGQCRGLNERIAPHCPCREARRRDQRRLWHRYCRGV